MKTRAAVIHEMEKPRPYATSRPLAIEELDLDPPGEGEILVKIRAAGLCHSDLSTINGDRPRQMPMVLGHEAAGEVMEVGRRRQRSHGRRPRHPGVRAELRPLPAVHGRTPGAVRAGLQGQRRRHSAVGRDAAEAATASPCGTTSASLRLPSTRLSRASRRSRSTARCRSRRRHCSAAPSSLAPAPSSTRPRCRAGASVAVVGLGRRRPDVHARRTSLGLPPDRRHRHARRQAEARQAARRHAYRQCEGPQGVEQVKDITQGGVDFAFEMASSVKALELAYKITRRGGTTVTASLPHPDAHHGAARPPTSSPRSARSKAATSAAACRTRDIPRFIALYQQGLLPVDRLMSERIGSTDINAGFDKLADGGTVRQILLP